MAARDKNAFEFFTRGGDVLRHKLSMFTQNLMWVFGLSIVAAIIAYFVSAQMLTSASHRTIWQYYQVARVETLAGLGANRWLVRDVQIPDIAGGDIGPLRPYQIVEGLGPLYHKHVAVASTMAALIAFAAFVASVLGIAYLYSGYGRKTGRDEHLRGAQLIDKSTLIEQVRKAPQGTSDYEFAGVPVPRGMQMRNFLATGGMGSGKSEALKDLAAQVAARGKKMIIYDKTGEYTEMLYRPERDVIMNPFDNRYPGWNIFKEIEYAYEFEQIAHSLIPDPERGNANSNYFTAGARTVFYSILQKLHGEGRCNTSALAEVLLTFTPAEMAEYLAGTPASAYISPKAAEQAAGVLSTLIGAIQVLQHIPTGDFGIREWVRQADDSRLFITSHESIHAVVRPLIYMYTDIAIRASMAGERTDTDRLWIFLDEAASLGAMPILKESLTEARKYGVCHGLGLQNVAQLQVNFGNDVTKTLRSNLQNFLILRVSDEETQEAYSKLLGSQELDEQTEGLSFGASAGRDGSNVQTARREKRIVMPSELKLLPDCEGYLQLAGAYDVAKVSYKPKTRQKHEPGFIQRPELRLPAPGSAAIKATPIAADDIPDIEPAEDEIPITEPEDVL